MKTKTPIQKIRNTKKGYTLVEMAVVMAIIAILSALGVGSFIDARQQFTLDKGAELLISQIRTAQNYSISTVRDDSGRIIKVWGVRITEDGFDLVGLYESGVVLASSNDVSGGYDFEGGITATITDQAGTVDVDQGYVFFSSPFSSSYLANSDLVTCGWTNSDASRKITKEYYPDSSTCETPDDYISSASSGSLIIDLRLGSKQTTITIGPDGDADVT